MADIEVAYEPVSLLDVHTWPVEGTEPAHWTSPGPGGPKAGDWEGWGGQCSSDASGFALGEGLGPRVKS